MAGVADGTMCVAVLGPCALIDTSLGDPLVELSAVQRRLVARLALDATAPVSVEVLADAVWGADRPRTFRPALQNQIARLRARLGVDAIRTMPLGYSLVAPTDAAVVIEEVAAAERVLAGDPERAFRLADGALARWRGTPFEELDALSEAAPVRVRLEEVRAAAEIVRVTAAVRLERTAWAVPEAERLVAAAPLDERRWAVLIQALDLAGRRGDALGAFERARRILQEQLGLEPGPRLQAAEAVVLGVHPIERHGVATRLIGRETELARLCDAARGGVRLHLHGESGVGKSAVLEALRRRLHGEGLKVAATRCVATPASPVSALADLLEALGEVADPVTGPIEGFVAAVTRASASGPVVLIVDDLHLAGPSSYAALRAAADLDRVALVGTVGDVTALDDDGALALTLPPLDGAEVRELAAELLVQRPPETTVAWLLEMSGGNPLFVESLLEDRALAPADADAPGAPRWPMLADLVRDRLDCLGTVPKAALEVAAVCGAEFPTALLDHLDAGPGVGAAIEAGLLRARDDGTTAFRHGAVQRIVYAGVAPGRRMELHHAAGLAASAAGAPSALVAHHLLAAVELDPGLAADTACVAAVDATAAGAHRDAARWYVRAEAAGAALGAAGTDRLIRARIGRGDSLRLAGDPEHERVLFDAAELAMTAGDAELIGEAAFSLLQLGATTETGTLHERAVALADHALATVTDRDQRAAIAAASSLAHSMSGHADRCRTLFLQAEADAVSCAARRKVLPFAYLGLGHPKDLDHRERVTAELLKRARDNDDPVAAFEGTHLAFSVALQRADGAGVRSALATMRDLVDRVGDVGRRWMLAYSAAAVAHLDDDLERSEQLSSDALELFAPVSPSRAMATYGAQLLVLRLAQDRLHELHDVFAHLVAEQPGLPAWHAAFALTAVEQDPAAARHHAALALQEVAEDFTWLAAHVIGGRAAAQVSDRPTVERYRERLRPWSGLVCWQGSCAYGPVDTALAALAGAAGDDADARGHRRIARRLARSLGAPVFEREADGLEPSR